MKKKSAKTLCSFALALISLVVLSLAVNAELVGDIDFDGNVTAGDARLVLRAAVGLNVLEDETEAALADVDEDDKITAADARDILRISVGLSPMRPYYTKEIIKEATCTQPGTCKRVCTEPNGKIKPDGSPEYDEYIETLEPLGHYYRENPVVLEEPTCTTDGKGKYVCRRCGKEKIVILPAGHLWTEPTCTEAAVCKRCGATGAAPLGHTTKLGLCARCGNYINEIPETTTAIKNNIEAAFSKCEEAFKNINYSEGAASWLPEFAGDARPIYVEASSLYNTAVDACGNYSELAEVKAKLYESIRNLNRIIGQIDVIVSVGIVDDSNFFTLIEDIDKPQFAIDELNKEIHTIIDKWK